MRAPEESCCSGYFILEIKKLSSHGLDVYVSILFNPNFVLRAPHQRAMQTRNIQKNPPQNHDENTISHVIL